MPVPAATLEGRARVVDGDTLELDGRRVRLFGIDAPELNQTCDRGGVAWTCGEAARSALGRMVSGKRLVCGVRDIDRYGRDVAICSVGGRDVGALMVRQGMAVAHRRYSDMYVTEEAAARAEGAGIWASAHVAPETHRQQGRVQAVPNPDCAIKGNIGAQGRRIYHLPGQADYAATRINEAKGERWFCTEAEARAAGFRRAAR